MKETKATKTARYFRSLEMIGVSYEDADKLRLIERTLHRWAELECGDGNEHGAWSIERDEQTGKPYFVHEIYGHGDIPHRTHRTPTTDREKGALKRLEKILEAYPSLVYYHQSDPRGCALWLVERERLNGDDISNVYTRGVACCVE